VSRSVGLIRGSEKLGLVTTNFSSVIFMSSGLNLETAKHVSRYYLLKAISEGRWEDACAIVYNDESYAKIEDNKGYLPLHLSVRHGCTARLVQLLITAYPESPKLKDPDGNLPLHLAVRHHRGRLWLSHSELSILLYNAYPTGIRETDKEGNLPLHLALRYKGPEEMIKFLLQVYPESVRILDPLGNTPLQQAIQFEGSYVLIFELLKRYPEAVNIPNRNGAYPLHKVAFFNCSLDIFELILNANPLIATKQDKNGNLPFHLACLNAGGPPNEAKLRLWLGVNSQALSTRNNNGLIPLMMFQRPQDNNIQDYV
jgi:ankyrin repeat protein